MVRVSAAHVVLFIAAVGVSGLVVGTMTVEVGRYAQSAGNALERETAVVDAEIDIVNDPKSGATYNATSETLTLYVENVGGDRLEPERLEVVVDGEYVTVDSTRVLEDDYWRPGRVLEVTVNATLGTGDHRAFVRIDGAEDVLDWEYREATFEDPDGGSTLLAAGATPLVGVAGTTSDAVDCVDDVCTVDAGTNRTLRLSMYTDPVQSGETIDYDVNDSSVATVGPARGVTGADGRNATTARFHRNGYVTIELDAGWDDDALHFKVTNATSKAHASAPDNLTAVHEGMEGSGTEDDPYVITNDHELQAVKVEADAHYAVGNPINASLTGDWYGGEGFDPIEDNETGDPFTGSLEGNDFTIFGLTVNRSAENHVGVFSRTDGAAIRNVPLENVSIGGGRYVGGLAGTTYAGTDVTDATVSGTVGGDRDLGGVVGLTRGSITDSRTNVTIEANLSNDDSYAGGVAGTVDGGTISASTSSGEVVGYDYLGGLVGSNGGDIVGSGSNATVNGTYNVVGGLVGVQQNNGTVSNSSASGDVSADYRAGGLVGRIYSGNVSNATASGNVSGTSWVGGLVGWHEGDVENSSASGAVTGTDSDIGGLVGAVSSSGTVSTSFAVGEVTGGSYVGGLVGDNGGSLVDSYWDNESTGQEDGVGTGTAGGTKLTTAEMTGTAAEDNMTALDFAETWTLTDGYPYHRSAIDDLTLSLSRTKLAVGDTTRATVILELRPIEGSVTATEPAALTSSDTAVATVDNDGTVEAVGDGTATITADYLGHEDGRDVDAVGLGGMSGSGTEDDPYIITDVYELQAMQDGPDAHYALGNDIDAAETETWNGGAGFDPIADGGFTGSLEGDGYAIRDLYIDRPDEGWVGLFYEVETGAAIRNVSLQGAAVTGGDYTGGLVGVGRNADVINVSFTGNVTGSRRTGGLAGWHEGHIADADVNATVSSGSDSIAGLVVADLRPGGRVSNSSVTGDVTGYSEIGGLAGWNDNAVIENSHANATVEGDSASVGGFVGIVINGGTISESTADSTVTGAGNVGGFIGRLYGGSVTNSSADGSVTGPDRVGGFVGQAEDEIRDSDADVAVNVTNDRGGGFAGYIVSGGNVSKTFATGEVFGGATVGGLAGENNGTLTDSYWDNESTGQEDGVGTGTAGGTKLTTAEMTGTAAEDNMTALDFENTWATTDQYPVHAWRESG